MSTSKRRAFAVLRACCAGMIDACPVDIELIQQIPRDPPGVQVVLPGPVEVGISELSAIDDLHHVGLLRFNEVPFFMAGFNVALMAWQTCEWSQRCNPVKLKEDLAVGVPNVSTESSEVTRYSEVIPVTGDSKRFSRGLGRGNADEDRRRAAVNAEMWDGQAGRVVEWCETIGVSSEGGPRRCAAS